MSVHDNKPISDSTSFQVLKELFHFLYWLYRSYSMDDVKQNIIFDPDLIPKNQVSVISESIQKVQELEEKVKQRDAQLEQREDLLKKSQEEIDKLLAEIKQRKEQLKKIPDSHNYNEAETRKFIIDILLQEAGWDINAKDVKEYPVIGMPNNQETGFVDYVLWGDNGLPLAVIEAKKTSKDPKIGRQQSKLYADCLEQMK